MSGGYRVDLGRMGSPITTLADQETNEQREQRAQNYSPSDIGNQDIKTSTPRAAGTTISRRCA
jgi:hypothetical protein